MQDTNSQDLAELMDVFSENSHVAIAGQGSMLTGLKETLHVVRGDGQTQSVEVPTDLGEAERNRIV